MAPLLTAALCLAVAAGACGPGERGPAEGAEANGGEGRAPTAAADGGELVVALHPATWFEDAWSVFRVSPDGRRAIFGARFGQRPVGLEGDEPAPGEWLADLDAVHAATFLPDGRMARRGDRGDVEGWFVEAPPASGVAAGAGTAPAPTSKRAPIPAGAQPAWSPDGRRVAYTRVVEAGVGEGLFVAPSGAADGEGERAEGDGDLETGPQRLPVDRPVSGLAWSPDGAALYAMVARQDGLSTLLRFAPGAVRPDDGGAPDAPREARTIADGLDATWRFNSIAVSPDGSTLFVALAGAREPDPAERHRPYADRDLDIHALDLETGELSAVVDDPGDDFYPQVVGGQLYWTHNVLRTSVVVVPAAGGEPAVLVEEGQIPYWRPDGAALAYTYGGWRLADWALNLDAAVVEVAEADDGSLRRVSEPEPIVVGTHEDFTPAWSPDGRWIAYHSHRSEGPVASYSAPGSTDDVYIRRADAPFEEEIRLTDFGWEVGMADWSPDGRRLAFDSWERGGRPGASKPWVATIDPDTGVALSIERIPLPDGVESVTLPSWSPDGSAVAVAERRGRGRQRLWVLPVAGGGEPSGSGASGAAGEAAVAGARPLVEFSASTYGGHDWLPDGSGIVYSALPRGGEVAAARVTGRMQLFVVPLDGGAPRQLTGHDASLILMQVSPDGRWIAATRVEQRKELRRKPLR